MKSLIRILLVAFFSLLANATTFASSLVCSAGPTAVLHGNNANEAIYTCTIPASSVAMNKAIRLTVYVTGSATTGLYDNYGFSLNGVALSCCGATLLPDNYFQITIMNTGSTTGAWIGVIPNHDSPTTSSTAVGLEAEGLGILSGLSWASAQTLEVYFEAGSSSIAQGQMFTVEILD